MPGSVKPAQWLSAYYTTQVHARGQKRHLAKERCLASTDTTVYTDWPSIHFPPVLMHLSTKSIFLHYTNDSTLTLLRNSLININKKHFFIVIKAPKMGGWGNEVSLSEYTVFYGFTIPEVVSVYQLGWSSFRLSPFWRRAAAALANSTDPRKVNSRNGHPLKWPSLRRIR